jgi:hypothetical protein
MYLSYRQFVYIMQNVHSRRLLRRHSVGTRFVNHLYDMIVHYININRFIKNSYIYIY